MSRAFGLHALRNALIPVVTVIGLQIDVLFTGALLTETIFSWPGVGKWLFESISRRVYPVLQCVVLLVGSMVMVISLLVDITYGIINPRIRHQRLTPKACPPSPCQARSRLIRCASSGTTSVPTRGPSPAC